MEKWIEVNLAMCKAILEMRSPTTVKGQIATLSRFMTRSIEKYLSFYKILKKDKPFRWSKDCENAFTTLKEYLSSPPILTRPEDGENLFLYIVVSDEAIRIVLIIERNDE